MSMGLKTSKDGTLLTTVGKKLVKSVRLKAADIRDPFFLSGQCKEITLAKVTSTLYLYVNEIKDSCRLTISDKSSIEAIVNVSWVQAPIETPDDKEFEIWIWN